MKRKPHVFSWVIKSINRMACPHCGLVLLRNEATEREVRRGCEWRDQD